MVPEDFDIDLSTDDVLITRADVEEFKGLFQANVEAQREIKQTLTRLEQRDDVLLAAVRSQGKAQMSLVEQMASLQSLVIDLRSELKDQLAMQAEQLRALQERVSLLERCRAPKTSG